MKKLVVLDGSSLTHRAFHALPLLTTTTGIFTNAVYGFINMLYKVVRQEQPDFLGVAFDKSRDTFRRQEYAAYKANRKATPDELRPQFPLIKKILGAMRIPVLELDGYEGDDLIGTLVKQAEDEGLEVLVVTGDRDMLQLVSSRTKALITKKGISELEVFTPEQVYQKFGIWPEQVTDLKGLVGDQSDNIPGVPGIGEKTAVRLLNRFGSLEGCLENLEQITGKPGKLLAQYRQQALLSKKLATLDTAVPVRVCFSDLELEPPDYEELLHLFQELEFKSLIRSLQEEMPATGASVKEVGPVARISRPDELEALLTYVLREGEVALSLLPPGRSPLKTVLRSLGLAWRGGAALVELPAEAESGERMRGLLGRFLADPACRKWCHDAKGEMLICRRNGLELVGVDGDTMLAAHLLNSSLSSPALEEIHLKYLNQGISIDDKDPLNSAIRAQAILSLWPLLRQELEKEDLWELYADLELPLSGVLAVMEFQGVRLEMAELDRMSREFGERLDELVCEIHRLAGGEFNINSPKQLGEVLFERLKLPVLKKTKTGYSTDAGVLERLAEYHPIAERLLEYRVLSKLKSTYVDGLRALIDPQTGRVHTTYNQTITATGRLSSTEPNLQNIPIRMELGRKIRRAFVPSEPDWLILAADYSQIELRVLAHMSHDEELIKAFRDGEDIHTMTAATVFGVSPEQVTPEMRRRAKGVNFGIIYGITDYGLSRDIGVSREEAAAYISEYFRRYPGVEVFIRETIAKAREEGFVRTLLKRRRFLPDLLSSNRNLRSFGERTAVNTPIQGSAADIIKLAMLRISRALEKQGLRARMILQVHDELIFELPGEELSRLVPLVRQGMEQVVKLEVPLEVDIEVGPNWYDLVKLEEYQYHARTAGSGDHNLLTETTIGGPQDPEG